MRQSMIAHECPQMSVLVVGVTGANPGKNEAIAEVCNLSSHLR